MSDYLLMRQRNEKKEHCNTEYHCYKAKTKCRKFVLLFRLYNICDVAKIHIAQLGTVIIHIWIFHFNFKYLSGTLSRYKNLDKKCSRCFAKKLLTENGI